jgi:excinuclease ABC subunit A
VRLLYARVGTPFCPTHGDALVSHSISQMIDAIMQFPAETRIAILAPVGQHDRQQAMQLCQQWQAQGYVRIQVNGQMWSLDPLPELPQDQHLDIEVVIDRLRVRPNSQSRLAESLETACSLAHGKALILNLDDQTTTAFSSRYACPKCDYTVSALEPRLFSFNSPSGACPTCDGLGHVDVFDPDKVVAFTHLSLGAGAIEGWDKRNAFTFALLTSLASHYGFDLDTAWSELTPEVQQIVLHGSGQTEIAFFYLDANGKSSIRHHPFEGVLPNLQRRWQETESSAVRDTLSRLRTQARCPDCLGSRLKPQARCVAIADKGIHEVENLTLADCLAWFKELALQGTKQEIAQRIVNEICSRLSFLNNVGLSYLSLDRRADTISGGEAQRIRLASQIGSGLTGVMYVLDEPSIGLHQRDNERLIQTLTHLRELGNSVLVVEHDEDMIRQADWVVDMGPGAGEHGGQVVAQGPLASILSTPGSLTGDYLSGRRQIAVPTRRPVDSQTPQITLQGCRGNNLKDVTLQVPLGRLVCVTGVSGSGKSTLINDTLAAVLSRSLNRSQAKAADFDSIDGLDHLDKIITVDQSPIGRTPRSNPATYTGLFTPIRELFAGVPEARARGYDPGRFSFNTKGGRCEACQGDGVVKVEMHFLPDMYVACEVCHGKRYNRETLEIRYRGKNIHEVLGLTIEQALGYFSAVPAIARRLQVLMDVGLSYLRLGQSATTLSGGEAQRVKLSLELSKRASGHTLYVLDEPTTGLHFHDIALLIGVLNKLVQAGNTIVVIEHNLDVIKTADWVIDLGPEGGHGGGLIVAQGTPEEVAAEPRSHTGQYLKSMLGNKPALQTATAT